MSKRSASKQREQPVYFVDRDFGPTETCDVIRILRAGGMSVEPHNKHFPDDHKPPTDPEWLTYISERRWIGLSADKEMSLSELAVRTLMTYGAKAFICIGAGRHGFSNMARNIVHSRHRMEAFIHKHRRTPFIARLYMALGEDLELGKPGPIKMYVTYAEWLERQRAQEGKRRAR